MIEAIPPAFLFLLGALFVPFFKDRMLGIYMLFIAVLGLLNLLNIPEGLHWQLHLANYTVTLIRADRLSMAFAYIFHIITLISVIYAFNLNKRIEQMAALAYAGAAMGVVFAGDLLSFFVFWEMLTLAATLLIWHGGRKGSISSGYRYSLMHAAGGVCLLAGIAIYVANTNSLEFVHIGLDKPGAWLIFLGFGLNCAWPGLHWWLTDSYPEASIWGTIFLSAFTTKCAVYALARGFAGTESLIWIGAVMAMFPIFYAVIENDLRRVLSYSLINQIGFMVVGIGIGSEMGINGAVAHAFADILFKGLLFMSMGAVMYRTSKINATDLGGLYKSMPLTCLFCIVGAASISAFPLFSAFATKSMIMDAACHGGLVVVWFMLLFASAGVFHHAGIKIPFFAFFSHDSGIRTKEAPINMLIAMGIAAFLCIFIGIYPTALYSLLPYPVSYEPYTGAHVVAQLQLLFFSALAFTLLMLSGIYPAEMRATNLDVDWFYRKLGRLFMRLCEGPLTALREAIARFSNRMVNASIKFATDPLLVPELIIRGAQVGIYKALSNQESQKSHERLQRLEAKLEHLRSIKATGRYYGTEMPRRPLGVGVLISFGLIFFYIVIYMLVTS